LQFLLDSPDLATPEPRVGAQPRMRQGDGRKNLFIATEVRCGSTFVAESLSYEAHENFGFHLWDLAKEHFAFLSDETTPEQLLTTWRALYLDVSGFVASKFMCRALSFLHRLARISEDAHDAFFGEDSYWIVIRRRDRVEQAVSLALATKTGTFHHYGHAEPATDRHTQLTLEEIDWALKAVALSDVYLESFFSSLPRERRVCLYYEDFVVDQVTYLNQIHELCGFPALDAAAYVNMSKLKPTGRDIKNAASAQFKHWLLENYA
jgi:LPS sulfotransferase NodH